MDGLEVYRQYCAIKAHFNSTYDYFKYSGKIRARRSSYQKRDDKNFFERLARKNMAYVIPFLVANFVTDKNLWVGDLVMNLEAEENYFAWKKKMSRLFMEAEEELFKVSQFMEARDISFNGLFEIKEDSQPILFRLMAQRFITLETYIIADVALGFRKTFDAGLEDDVVYQRWAKKITAYEPFLDLPRAKCLKLVRKIFL